MVNPNNATANTSESTTPIWLKNDLGNIAKCDELVGDMDNLVNLIVHPYSGAEQNTRENPG